MASKNNPPRIMITQVTSNGRVLWQDPSWAYQQAIDTTENRLPASDFKEAKEVIAKIMERK